MIKDLIEISTTELKNANFRKSFKRLLLAECIHNLNVLETHHIIFQNDFDDNNKCNIISKTHIKKNQESNLVNLCKFHHLDVHKNKITIHGWIKTSSGKKLDYIMN